jgi:type I restriction enzyme S subunit
MSKLDILITELCPKGVEYKELQEVFTIRNGYTPSKDSPEFWENGTIPWFRMEDIRENGHILSDSIQHITAEAVKGSLFPAYSIIVATSATIGEHALLKVEALANQRFTFLTRKEEYLESLDMKYFFYQCYVLDEWCKQNTTLGNFNSVDMKRFRQYRFPMPPLAVQSEIVRILDNFTELTAELEAELEARKKQYEYYRNLLLTFDANEKTVLTDRQTRWLTLNEVGIMRRGTYVTQKNTVQGDIPVILGGQEPAYYCDTSNHEGEAIVMSRSGAYAGFVSFWNQPIFVTDGFILEASDKLSIKYLYYYLKNMQNTLHEMKRGGGVPHVRGNEVMNIKIPVPPIEEQSRIVAILDRFDALTNDITSGLPAEIEARRKQYEYYRDKLLTFREVTA